MKVKEMSDGFKINESGGSAGQMNLREKVMKEISKKRNKIL
jgi:hypothetical protein